MYIGGYISRDEAAGTQPEKKQERVNLLYEWWFLEKPVEKK